CDRSRQEYFRAQIRRTRHPERQCLQEGAATGTTTHPLAEMFELVRYQPADARARTARRRLRSGARALHEHRRRFDIGRRERRRLLEPAPLRSRPLTSETLGISWPPPSAGLTDLSGGP